MKPMLCLISLSLLLAAASGGCSISEAHADDKKGERGELGNRLVVHEWGTFTSIAGESGSSLDWRPLSGPSDLPSFVYTSANLDGGASGERFECRGKGCRKRIRMETPVIYFYSENSVEVEASVSFPEGEITEWYPAIRDTQKLPKIANWGRFLVVPGADEELLEEEGESHYYPARHVKAATLKVCGEDGRNEYEKFLFYRGVADFETSLSVTLNEKGRGLDMKYTGPGGITYAFVFESDGEKMWLQKVSMAKGIGGELRPSRFFESQSKKEILKKLKDHLMDQGLFGPEAAAMIETWEETWFEKGLRVFYVLTQEETDQRLPLTINPNPDETVRVLVGRVEVLTPEFKNEVRTAVEELAATPQKGQLDAGSALVASYGRFAEPVLEEMLEHHNPEVVAFVRLLLPQDVLDTP